MGGRITANLRHLPHYEVDYVEASEERSEQMAKEGIETSPLDAALGRAEAVILAVPDRLIGAITHQIVPKLNPGTIVLGLDPAAAYAGVMPNRRWPPASPSCVRRWKPPWPWAFPGKRLQTSALGTSEPNLPLCSGLPVSRFPTAPSEQLNRINPESSVRIGSRLSVYRR
jgi:hypothetical protein